MINPLLTINAETVKNNYKALVEMGVSQQALDAILAPHKALLEVRDSRIPFFLNIEMIEKGIELVGEGVPIRIGQSFTAENIGVYGYILQNCSYVDEAIKLFLRYQELLYSISSFKADTHDNRMTLSHKITLPSYQHYRKILTELNFAAILQTLRKQLRRDIIPLELCLSYAKPDIFSEYKAFFQCPIKFNQPQDAIVFHKDLLTIPIGDSRPYLKQVLIKHAEQLLSTIEKDKSITGRVRHLALEWLPKGNFDIELAAEKLTMSRWSLTRKLKTEGWTFRNLVKQVRKEAALNYLEKSELNITEITFMLGYSEESAFSRAFKQWTGHNPFEHRQIKMQDE